MLGIVHGGMTARWIDGHQVPLRLPLPQPWYRKAPAASSAGRAALEKIARRPKSSCPGTLL
jgi:hypothetical protein